MPTEIGSIVLFPMNIKRKLQYQNKENKFHGIHFTSFSDYLTS